MIAQPITPARPVASPGRIAWASLAAAAVLAAADGLAAGRDGVTLHGWVAIVEGVSSAAACLLAGRTFERGEHLRRAWLLLGASQLALAGFYFGDVLGVPEVRLPSWYLPALTLACSATQLVGMWLFAIAWLRTGLPMPGSRRTRLVAWAVILAGGALVMSSDLAQYVGKALRGDVYAGVLAASDLSDLAVLLVAVPLIQTARALAGGSLAWPFRLIAYSYVAWVLFDGIDAVAANLGVPGLAIRVGSRLLQALGCALLAAAALTHRQAIRSGRGAGRA